MGKFSEKQAMWFTSSNAPHDRLMTVMRVYDIRTVQELLGHRDVKTIMIYTHVLNRRPVGIRSPLDGM